MEKRYINIADLRVEQTGGEDPTIAGYAVVFDELSVVLFGEFRERITPEAFGNLEGADIRALWNHDAGQVLGRTANGTLSVWKDDRGIAFELTPPNTTIGRDALESIRRGDVDQMSFGFNVNGTRGAEWSHENGVLIRTILDATLYEISPVAFPAYPQTAVSTRSLTEIYGDIPEIPEDDPNLSDDGRAAEVDDTANDAARARRHQRRLLDLLDIGV